VHCSLKLARSHESSTRFSLCSIDEQLRSSEQWINATVIRKQYCREVRKQYRIGTSEALGTDLQKISPAEVVTESWSSCTVVSGVQSICQTKHSVLSLFPSLARTDSPESTQKSTRRPRL